MEITKKEVEELIGDEILTYKVTKSYRGYKVIKLKVVAIKAKDSKEVTITLKPNKQFRFASVHIFICMIRTLTNKSGEFIIINASLEVKDKGQIIRVPLFVQVDVTPLDQDNSNKVFRAANSLFNRTVTLNLIKPIKDEKPWWKKLFNK